MQDLLVPLAGRVLWVFKVSKGCLVFRVFKAALDQLVTKVLLDLAVDLQAPLVPQEKLALQEPQAKQDPLVPQGKPEPQAPQEAQDLLVLQEPPAPLDELVQQVLPAQLLDQLDTQEPPVT